MFRMHRESRGCHEKRFARREYELGGGRYGRHRQHWGEGAHFHFKAENGQVVLETGGPHLALAYGA